MGSGEAGASQASSSVPPEKVEANVIDDVNKMETPVADTNRTLEAEAGPGIARSTVADGTNIVEAV